MHASGFRLGERIIYGGSCGVVLALGTVHRDGLPTPQVIVDVPDFGPPTRLTGNTACYSIHADEDDA